MMKPQGTIKLLTDGMRIGLALVVAGVASGAAQTAPAQLNGVRQTLNSVAQSDSKTPSTAKPPAAGLTQSKPAMPQSQVKTPSAAAAPKSTGNPAAASTAKPTLPQSPANTPSAAAASKSAGNPATASTAKPTLPQSQVKTPSVATAPKAVSNPGAPSTAKPVQATAQEKPSTPGLRTIAAHSTVSRRDPFNPLLNQEKGVAGPQTPLPAGKPGLVIATLRVDGIVRGPGGMIAVVSNPQMRVYFLREGDRLYDGAVAHITMEGVSFHETGRDAFGKAVERESTKRLYPTPGELQ
jgi:hypothetical protein